MKLSQQSLVRLGAVVVGVLVLFVVINSYSSGKSAVGEGMEVGGLPPQGPLSNTPGAGPASLPNPHSEGGNMYPTDAVQARHPSGQQTYTQSVLSPDELLPKGGLGASWAATNPVGADSVKNVNFLAPGYHYGINTVGQTLRNANLDLRADVPNPRVPVSPFLNSTIEPDLRRGLELQEV
jgi:hypothetical protein